MTYRANTFRACIFVLLVSTLISPHVRKKTSMKQEYNYFVIPSNYVMIYVISLLRDKALLAENSTIITKKFFSHVGKVPKFLSSLSWPRKKSTNATQHETYSPTIKGRFCWHTYLQTAVEEVRQNMWDFGRKINILGGKTKALLMTTQMHAYHWTLLSLWAMCYVHLPTRPTSEPTMFSNLFILCHY